MSVNIQKILAHRQMPPRASSTVSVLMLVVVIGLAALIPQPSGPFGSEVFVSAAITWAILLLCAREIITEHLKDGRRIIEFVIGLPGGHVAAIAILVGAALLWLARNDGLYWIAGGAMVALVIAVMNAWVFLIEVLR